MTVFLIWVAGFCSLEVAVLISDWHYQVDAFEVGPTVPDRFENTFKSVDNKVASDVKQVLLNVARGTLDARSRPQAREELLGLFPKDDTVTSPMLSWLVDECAEGKVQGLLLAYLEVYLPWLLVMFPGLLAEDTGQKNVPKNKCLASISLSIVLQLFFLIVLVNTLINGDLNGMRDVTAPATFITSVVGVLVGFVFPSAPHAQASGDNAPAQR